MNNLASPNQPSAPTIFIIYGITGDLAARKLIPALLSLYTKKLLPSRFLIIGFSRRIFSREEFREFIRGRMNIKLGQFKEEDVKHFLDHILYEQGMFDDAGAYARLAAKMKMIDNHWGQCSNKLHHLSVPPTLYEKILGNIARSGLAEVCGDGIGWTRILIEKPFGSDSEMACRIDRLLGSLFKEEQIFRIDHYLAKEVLQNIMAFRFSNSIFEPLWNKNFIDKIHIKLLEKTTMEGRGASYDPIGALKDVGQNHLLMMLAIVAMECPKSFRSRDIRRERAKILAKLKQITPRSINSRVVRGQYLGYTQEVGIKSYSQTETYFRIQAFINSMRWKNIPFYLESGKALAETKSEIDVYFKKNPRMKTFGGMSQEQQNILTFRIHPDEGIHIRFLVKVPGYDYTTELKTLKFKYNDVASFDLITNDYERLIHDAFIGDQSLFASTDEIMASWKFMMPILENLKRIPLTLYERGAREVN